MSQSVSLVTHPVNHAYSRYLAGNGKLTYMGNEKRELDPRAIRRGRTILVARERLRLSQEELAKAVGVGSRESVSNWERGTVGDIERSYRLGLCKVLGLEERELLLDPEGAEKEFDVPISAEAKSIAYRWDDLPEQLRLHLRAQIAEAERLIRESPELAKRVYPQLAGDSPRSTKS